MTTRSTEPTRPGKPASGPPESSFDRLVMGVGLGLILLMVLLYFLFVW